MKVPLSVVTLDDSLIIHRNSKTEKIELPFRPFALLQKDAFEDYKSSIEKWTKVPEDEVREYLKLEFKNLNDLNSLRKEVADKSKYALINNYLEQLFISEEDFLLKYPHTNNLTVMFYDIEVATKGEGRFPRAISNEILCIGYSIWDYLPDGSKKKIHHEICKGFDLDKMCDKKVLENFFDAVKKWDPDVIADFNGASFDMPYIFERCDINHLNLKHLSRDGRLPVINKGKVYISGRVHFDIYTSNSGAIKDQTLCYDEKTEILTENGWKFFKDLKPREKVATLNKETDTLEYQVPLNIQQYDYNGLMYKLKAKSVDLLVTENHDMYIKYPEYKNDWCFKKPIEILHKRFKVKRNVKNWKGKTKRIFRLPKIKRKKMEYNYSKKELFDIKDWLEFLGYYISEGSCYIETKNGLYNINISQSIKNKENVKKIRKCIEKMGFSTNYYHDIEGNGVINFKSKRMCYYLKRFGLAHDKYIPRNLLSLNKKLLKILFDALMLGDGTLSKVSKDGYNTTLAYSTASKKLSNNIQELGIKLGYAVSESIENINKNNKIYTIYRIRFLSKQVEPIVNNKKNQDNFENYNGKVFCCTVPNNIILVRRNGYSLWSGNSGIKSRGLKELARWYKIKKTILKNGTWCEETLEDVEVPEHIQNLLKLYKENRNLLYSYLDDDVYRSEGVGHVYIRNCITLAEMMKVPLDNIINMYSSFIPKLFIARNMKRLGLINTETNFSKYNIESGSIEQLGMKYEGALVGLYKDGYFPKVYKLDFSSMYPSCIQTWNLGPDTTKLIRIEPYTGKYKCIVKSKHNWYRIPTKFENGKYAYDLIVRVRTNIDGFLKKEITNLKKERKRIKKEMTNEKGDKKIALHSQQWAIKIVLNSIYGTLALKSSKYGDMITSVMVAAMCRWTTAQVIRRYKNLLVELDTDGLILTEKVDEYNVNKWLDKIIYEKFNIKDNHMVMELEGGGESAYFYRMKNYILQNEDGSYSIHGSSMKASKTAKIVDRAIKLGIEWIFNDKPPEEVVSEAYNFDNLELEDFVERENMSKDPREYDDPLDRRLFLAEQIKYKTGEIITKGSQMNFVVTKDRLPYKELSHFYRGDKNYTYTGFVTNKDELDYSYYEEKIDKALKKFGISKEKLMKTDLFTGTSCEKRPLDRGKLSKIPEEEL